MRRRERLPRLLTGLCLCAALAAQEGATPTLPPDQRPRPVDATALFARMATVTGLEATFREEKHAALLALPLRSEGRLYFHRPDPKGPGWLTRVVEKPEPATVRMAPEANATASCGDCSSPRSSSPTTRWRGRSAPTVAGRGSASRAPAAPLRRPSAGLR